MSFEHELVDRQARLGVRPRDPDEAHNRTVRVRLREQLGELPPSVEPIVREACDDAHPPDTGGRNSTLSEPTRTW